jgi:16S rRNA (uracil1498-N3)-methyltransferase
MSRTYRFFARHLAAESLPQTLGKVFTLTESLEPEIFFQLLKVLRVQPGDQIVLLPAIPGEKNEEFFYTVVNAHKKAIEISFVNKQENENELSMDLGIILCLPNKPDKLELMLQKAVELGTKRIVLVSGDRSQMKHGLRDDRLGKIITEAAEQSERAVVPELIIEVKLSDYLQARTAAERSSILAAMERSGAQNDLLNVLTTLKSNSVDLLIGPEGGFSDAEKMLIEKLEIKTYSLGKRILRMETAAILSLGIAAINE